jgi:hypothetical protein
MNPIQPSIGQWYLNKDLGRRFEVIGIDADRGTIELQDEEGFLDEMDRDMWFNAKIEFTPQPDDLSDIFDDVSEPDEADGANTEELDADEDESKTTDEDED